MCIRDRDCAALFDGVEAPEDFRVGLVTDIGKVDDGTFNQFAHEGALGALECFGIPEDNYSVIETVSEADYEANIATTLEADPDVVITVGFLIADATVAAAQANPDVTFIGIDQFADPYPDNMVGVLFNEDEGGYMAGAFAAALSESGVVGVVGGREDVPPVVKFVNGYRAGAEATDPNISVLEIYNESFTDPAKGGSDAAQFLGEGADVIFGAGGKTGSGGIAAAAEAGAWAIGVDQDEYFTTFSGGEAPGSEFLATSAIKRVDLSVQRNIGFVLDGTFAGGAYALTAANDGITYAPFHDADIPEEAAEVLETTRAGLAAGAISTGICGIDGLFLGNSACDGAEEETEETEETTTTTEATEEATTTTEAEGGDGGEEAGGTIIDVATEAGFTTLVAAVEAAGLTDALSDPNASLTVFAPTDEAFEAAIAELGTTPEDLLAREDLADILTYHVADGLLTAEDVAAADGTDVPTLNGATVAVGGGGTTLTDQAGRAANVTQTDVEARNGIIHAIDNVLLPAAP